MKKVYFFALVLLFLNGALFGKKSLLWAGQFTVAPIRVDLSTTHPTATLEVTNQDVEEITIHSTVLSWRQENNQDMSEKTEDILVVPMIFTLAPKKSQVLRFAFRPKPHPTQELSYRLVLKEVPNLSASHPISQSGIIFRLNISIPIFIAPQRTPAKESFEWRGKLLNPHQVNLSLQNTGEIHLVVNRLSLLSSSEEVPIKKELTLFQYVLPKKIHSWILPISSIKMPLSFKVKALINGVETIQNVVLEH